MKPSLISQVHQAVLGIPNTEDKGIVGDIKEIKVHLENHSKRIVIVETLQRERNKVSKKTLSGYGAIIVALLVSLWKAFTG